MCNKIEYTKKEAKAARKEMGAARKIGVDYYCCKQCGKFHLTSRGTGKRLPKTKKKFRFDPNMLKNDDYDSFNSTVDH